MCICVLSRSRGVPYGWRMAVCRGLFQQWLKCYCLHGTLNNAPQGCSRAPLGRRKVCFHSQTHRRSLLPLHLGQTKNDGQPQAFCSSFIKHERLFSRASQMEMHLSCFQKVGNSGHFVSKLLFF